MDKIVTYQGWITPNNLKPIKAFFKDTLVTLENFAGRTIELTPDTWRGIVEVLDGPSGGKRRRIRDTFLGGAILVWLDDEGQLKLNDESSPVIFTIGKNYTQDFRETLRPMLREGSQNILWETKNYRGMWRLAGAPQSVVDSWGPSFSEQDLEDPKDAIGQVKLDLGHVPVTAQVEIALAMLQGALKYGYRNFRHFPVKASVYIAAAKRHLAKFEAGEDFDIDADAAVAHLGAVGACVAILIDAAAHETLIDDREKSEVEADYIDDARERVEILQRKLGTDTRLLPDRE